MVSITLHEDEAAILREVIVAQLRELPHEIHRTHDRAFKELLRQKEQALERLLAQLSGSPESR